MGGFFNVVESEKAYEFIDSLRVISETEIVDVRGSIGRVLVRDIMAGEDLPGFDRSTVDGYAIRSSDTFGASISTPAMLRVVGEIKIDEEYEGVLEENEALKLPTGGKLPEGADAVVMIEDTREAGDLVEVFRPVAPGQNVMKKDEDISKGSTVAKRGDILGIGHVALLLNLGMTEVEVYRRLKVGLISTGDEVIEPERFRTFPYVRDSNTHSLKAFLEKMGFRVKRYGISKDDFDELRSFMYRSYEENDVTVSAGGSSVGVRDYTVEAINSIGKPGVMIHGVLVSPGKPTIFGVVNDHPFVGLPGHPSSFTLSSFTFLVPLLRKVSGASAWRLQPTGFFKLTDNVFSRQGRETFIWSKRVWRDGRIWVKPLMFKSGMISPASVADGFIRIPAGVEGYYEGDEVEFYSIAESLLI